MKKRAFIVFTALLAALLLIGCTFPKPPASASPLTTASAPTAAQINVDDCGASPWDDLPDSDAIQKCIDRAGGGDLVTFTSGIDSPNYKGYLIDKTVFLVDPVAKSNLNFTSTDPHNPALLKAMPDLKGFVVRLFARSRIQNSGDIDNITFSHLNLDGGRDRRVCFGKDNAQNGVGDNWGSWLPECTVLGDAWCSPGSLAMAGAFDWDDPQQDFQGNPGKWSTGLAVDGVTISNTECGTALAFNGAAGSIRNSTIQTAGDHVHVAGCSMTDNDEASGGWSDGITFLGPANNVTDNSITDASDVGIVFFGGKGTAISNNTVQAGTGNHGMFAGIGVHAWNFGDVSDVQVVGNKVINKADARCGGIHAGINIGPHMWGAGCMTSFVGDSIGNSTKICLASPPKPKGAFCKPGTLCEQWAYVAPGATFTLRDNSVSGAQINYLIEGLDLEGTLVESGNTSEPPRMTDWEAAKAGCQRSIGGVNEKWGPLDRVAHDPSLPGWIDERIHCVR